MASNLNLSAAGAKDCGAFLARLVRLEPAALVRLRAAGDQRVALWARLPWEALVMRTVDGGVAAADVTVPARALLASLAAGEVPLPPQRDADWRWAIPASGGVAVESLPAAQVRALGSAAERTVRAAVAGGAGAHRSIGERAVRDAVLDHVAIVVESTVSEATIDRVDVPQRLVQAVVRMGFLRSTGDSAEPPVRVLVAGRFVGLAAEYGTAWYRSTGGLGLRAIV